MPNFMKLIVMPGLIQMSLPKFSKGIMKLNYFVIFRKFLFYKK